MEKLKLTPDEQETNINWDNSRRGIAEIQTFDKALIRQLNKYVEEGRDGISLTGYRPEEGVYFYTIPKKWVKISPPRKLNLTDEEKAERAARMSGGRSSDLGFKLSTHSIV